MKALAIAGMVLTVAAAASASPLKAPKRVVNQQTVDLTPLFHWWTNQSGARPLTAWVHVTGNVVGTNSYGWVLEGKVEASVRPGQEEGAASANGSGPKRILLRHPPLQDRAAFEQLAAQYKAWNGQRAQAASAESQAHTFLHGSNGVHQVRFKRHAWQRQELAATEKDAAASKKALDKQLQDLKAKLAAWPSPDIYQLDCFALDTRTEQNRLPVYEHGMSW
jgi:hypothetical protein